jgi:hypothetical protein
MMTPRLVPWVDWSEWASVRGLLFSAELAEQHHGVQRVAAWRARCAVDAPKPTTPLPVLSSPLPRPCDPAALRP